MRNLSTTLSGNTIGVDLGDRTSHYCVVDREAAVIERGKFDTTAVCLQRAFSRWAPSRVVMEVGTHSPWVSHGVEKLGHEVFVANARHLRAIFAADNKSDRVDAEKLARLGRFDVELLHPIRHRSPQAQADLARIRTRAGLVETRTAQSNRIRGIVKSFGGRIPSDIRPEALPKKARAYIPEELKEALEPMLKVLAVTVAQIRELEKEIQKLCEERYPETEALRQVRGVGWITSLSFVLTIEDPDRFDRCREVGPYLGLVPRRDASGKRDPELSITKAGDKQLRWLLVQCAHYMLGRYGEDSDLRRWGLALAARGKKNAKKRAVVAVARKLAVLLLSLWKSGEEYEPLRNSERAKAA
jgi:transposase